MFMIFKPMPLTRMSLVAVSKYLWASPNISKITENDSFGLEHVIIKSLPQFGLPTKLREELEWVISAMGDSLNMWRENTRKAERQMLYEDVSAYKRVSNAQIIWNQQGEVVRNAMAFLMVRDEYLNIFQSYRLSCYYCFVGFSRFLFDRFTKDVKRILLQDPNYAVRFWTGLFLGVTKPTVDAYKCIFALSLKDRNLFGAEHFWRKLPKHEREVYLMDIDKTNFGPLWAFAFHANDLDPEERKSFFSRFGGVFIRRLVHLKQYEYIYQEAFVEAMRWIDDVELGVTTWNIAMPFFENWPSCYRNNGQGLFLSLWDTIPAERKKGLLSSICNTCALLIFLSHPRELRLFRVVLEDVDLFCDRKALLNSNTGMYLLERFIRYRRLQAFKLVVGNYMCPDKIRKLLILRRKENIQLNPLHYTKDTIYTNDLNCMLRWFREIN